MGKANEAKQAEVLWLLPAAAEREFLRGLVARLATECDAPIFEPHLTLGRGGEEKLETTQSAELLAAHPIRLRILGLDFSARFTKTLFLRLELSASLRALLNSMELEVTDDFDPHVSLLYQTMPEARQEQLAGSIALPFSSILFDAVAAVRCPDPTISRKDVERWEIIATRDLGNAVERQKYA